MSRTDSIVEQAVNVRTMEDVRRLESALTGQLGMVTKRFLGDREANFSALSSPADPTSVPFERVTNMWDAVIELAALRLGRHDWLTPADAVAELFGVRHGVAELSEAERERLARLCTITLHDSDDSKKRPTISFRDLGIGLSPSEMPKTILSLEENNKLKKPYLHGIFGKGGSSACVFSDATVIVSRKQPDQLAGEPDLVSVVVIQEEDEPGVGLPYYRYFAGGDNLPFSVPASTTDFEPGTLVIHVNYQAGKMGIQQWTYEESIYANAETLLFKPTLPYMLHDDRSPQFNTRPEDRQRPSVLSGLAQRLERTKTPGLIAQSNWTTIPVPGVGDVRLRWWLFNDKDLRRKRAAKGYVVLFTTNGQIHHAWDQLRMQTLVERRRRVSQRIIVEVDCDAISLKKRYKVFDSFRAQVRRGLEGRAMEAAVRDALANDPDLDDRESEFIRQSQKASKQEISEAFRRRLNRAIKMKVPGLAATGRSGPNPRPPKPKPPIDLYPEPTTFTGPEAVTALIGARTSIYFEINAEDGFVPDKGSIIASPETGAIDFSFSIGDLRRGRLRVGLLVPEGTQEDVYLIDFSLEWIRASGGFGRLPRQPWTVKVHAVPELQEKENKPTGGRKPDKAATGDIAFLWSRPAEQDSWTPQAAGDLQFYKGSDLATLNPRAYGSLKHIQDTLPTIVLNQEFPDWLSYHDAIHPKVGDEAWMGRKDRYGLALGVTVAHLYLSERKLHKKYENWKLKGNGSPEPSQPMTPDQMHRAVAEAARGIIALMPDFDALLDDLGEPTPEE